MIARLFRHLSAAGQALVHALQRQIRTATKPPAAGSAHRRHDSRYGAE